MLVRAYREELSRARFAPRRLFSDTPCHHRLFWLAGIVLISEVPPVGRSQEEFPCDM
jgi:hypothetical protein